MHSENNNAQRIKLINLGSESLADFIIRLSEKSDHAYEAMERLIATPEENTKMVKKKMASIKRSKFFYHRPMAKELVHKLLQIIDGISKSAQTPKEGLDLVCAFFELDKHVFERCDDSYGNVGDVFRFDACDLFCKFASSCKDEKAVVSTIKKIAKNNDYGARDNFLEKSGEFLSENTARKLIADFHQYAEKAENDSNARNYDFLSEDLAKTTKDPKLFEKCVLASKKEHHTASLIEVAEFYFENGDAETAYKRISKLEGEKSHISSERDALLLKIYRKNGWSKKEIALRQKLFKRNYDQTELEELKGLAGESHASKLLESELDDVANQATWSLSRVNFLLDHNRNVEAEDFVVKWRDEISGAYFHEHLAELAEKLALTGSGAGASVVLRQLLLSVLENANTKHYKRGASYLKKLDLLSDDISDWKGLKNHTEFKASVQDKHFRKKSFWAKYES